MARSEVPADSNSDAAIRSSSEPSTSISSTEGAASNLSAVEAHPCDPALGRLASALQVGDPLAAAVRPLDPGDEARHDLLQLLQDHRREVTRLRQWRGQHPQEQLLVGLAGGEDPDMAQGRRRQQSAEEVERLGFDGALPGRLGLVAARPAFRRPLPDLGERGRVDREELLHRLGVGGAELAVAVEAVAAAGRVRQRLVVGDVAGRLLEVSREAAALEDLGEDVRDPLARDVRAADLRDRVVAVAHEDAFVEPGRALALLALEGPSALRHVGRELIEVEAAQRVRIAGVAGEERSLDRLREVDEREDGTIEVREVG